MKKAAFLFVSIFFCCLKFQAQLCGGGLVNINLYTLNGEKIKALDYEFLTLSSESLGKYENQVARHRCIIPDSLARKLIFKNDSLEKILDLYLEETKTPRTGTLERSMKLLAHELTDFPVILKLNTSRGPYYLVRNFFGGCGTEITLLWTVNGLKIYPY